MALRCGVELEIDLQRHEAVARPEGIYPFENFGAPIATESDRRFGQRQDPEMIENARCAAGGKALLRGVTETDIREPGIQQLSSCVFL